MLKKQFDALDRRILTALQADGKLTNLQLAERIGLSPSPCLRRLHNLEAAGIIEGYRAKVNRHKVGLDLAALILVKLEKHGLENIDRLRRTIATMPEITTCYIISGEMDLFLHVVLKDLAEYRQFMLERLARLQGVREFRTTFVVDVYKEDAPLPMDG